MIMRLAALTAIAATSCANVHADPSEDGAPELLPECAEYAAAFKRCATATVGAQRAELLPHPIFQPVYQDDASKEKARDTCRAAAARTVEACR